MVLLQEWMSCEPPDIKFLPRKAQYKLLEGIAQQVLSCFFQAKSDLAVWMRCEWVPYNLTNSDWMGAGTSFKNNKR